MPTAPMLPSEAMQSSSGAPTNPLNFLIAAADMQKNGQLPSQANAATPQRSMPKGPSLDPLRAPRRGHKNIRLIK